MLEQAGDPTVPLLERLKFLGIYRSNLEEFFMVRVGSLTHRAALLPDERDEKTGCTPGEQVSAVNLLLLETNISVISGDKEGRLKVRTTGEGDGLLCRNGQSVPIHWSRADRNSPFVYTTADGQPLALGRGNSYVCIMDPKTSKVECS